MAKRLWAALARLWLVYSAMWQLVAKARAALSAAWAALLTRGVMWGLQGLYQLASRLWVWVRGGFRASPRPRRHARRRRSAAKGAPRLCLRQLGGARGWLFRLQKHRRLARGAVAAPKRRRGRPGGPRA
jgi:hypothetical protein